MTTFQQLVDLTSREDARDIVRACLQLARWRAEQQPWPRRGVWPGSGGFLYVDRQAQPVCQVWLDANGELSAVRPPGSMPGAFVRGQAGPGTYDVLPGDARPHSVWQYGGRGWEC